MIPSELPDDILLIQLGEECGELIQAAMKSVRREYCENNDLEPFVQERFVLENNLIEEMADVQVTIEAFLVRHPDFRTKLGEIRHIKELRWCDRLNCRNDE